MKVLVTGFDPFGGEKVNPAYEAVKLLPDTIAGAEIIKIEIPTVFTRSAEVVEEAIKKYEPDMVLDVGQAGGRSCMTVERVAINLKEARIPDNDGDRILFHTSGKSNGGKYESPWNSGTHFLYSRNLCMQLHYVQCALSCSEKISWNPRRICTCTI